MTRRTTPRAALAWITVILAAAAARAEPGIYVPAGSDGVDPRWWNIGVRIEDDVVVTEDGHRVLSGDAPRTAAAIEALMVGRGMPDLVP